MLRFQVLAAQAVYERVMALQLEQTVDLEVTQDIPYGNSTSREHWTGVHRRRADGVYLRAPELSEANK